MYSRICLKGHPVFGAFLHISVGNVFFFNSLDVSTLLLNKNTCYLKIKQHSYT